MTFHTTYTWGSIQEWVVAFKQIGENVYKFFLNTNYFSSLQVHNESYDGFRRLSATFEELEERVNASDTDDEDVDDSEDIR